MKTIVALVGAVVLSGFAAVAGAADRPALGVTLGNSSNGALVTGVYAGSPASRAGLMAGDQIVSINGQKVGSYQDVINMVSKADAGAKLNLAVNRLGWNGNVNVTLADSAAVFQAPIAGRSTAPVARPVTTTLFQPLYTPADIDDQHAFGD